MNPRPVPTTRPTVSTDDLPVAAPSGARGGMALVTVLMVMVAVMVLGAGSLMMTNSNLMVSENVLSSAVARSQAEAGVDAIVAVLFEQYKANGTLPASLAYAPSVTLPNGQVNYALASSGYVRHDDHRVTVRAVGYGPRGAEYVAEALLVFAAGEGGYSSSPYTGGVIACQAVVMSGSGSIDSFDSREGLYSSGTARANGHVRTLEPNATVTLSGSAPLHGDLNATGGLTISGSATIHGEVNASGNLTVQSAATFNRDIRTTGNVALNNSARVNGSVVANGDVVFNNAARVQGDTVSAQGRIHFENTSGYTAGDARAATTVTTKWWTGNPQGQNVGGSIINAPSTLVEAVPTEACDPLNLPAAMQPFQDLPNTGAMSGTGNIQWEISPTGVRTRTSGSAAWVDQTANRSTGVVNVLGENRPVLRLSSLSMGNSSQLHITGGDVVLYVDGNVSFGGASFLKIDPGSSLTIFVTGTTTLGNGSSMSSVKPINNSPSGLPTLSIFSSYAGNGTGVTVSGSTSVTASVYAPYTKASKEGSGALHGSVRAREVSVSGAGKIHYDEALAEAPIGESRSGEGGEARLVAISRR